MFDSADADIARLGHELTRLGQEKSDLRREKIRLEEPFTLTGIYL